MDVSHREMVDLKFPDIKFLPTYQSMAASPGVLEDMKSLFLGDETAV